MQQPIVCQARLILFESKSKKVFFVVFAVNVVVVTAVALDVSVKIGLYKSYSIYSYDVLSEHD